MDAHRFDDLVRVLSSGSRRQLLRLLAGGLTGALLGLGQDRPGAAKSCRRHDQCGQCGVCRDGRCRPKTAKCTASTPGTAGCWTCVKEATGTFACQAKTDGVACRECGRCQDGFCAPSIDRVCPTSEPHCLDTGACTKCDPFAGDSPCGKTCCNQFSKQTCCNGACCESNEKCVNGQCKKVCPVGIERCGSGCCLTEKETCCSHADERCCKKSPSDGAICCSDGQCRFTC